MYNVNIEMGDCLPFYTLCQGRGIFQVDTWTVTLVRGVIFCSCHILVNPHSEVTI